MYGKRGEIPPLPRNCNRRGPGMFCHRGLDYFGKAARRFDEAKSQETDQTPIFGPFPVAMGEPGSV